MGGKELKSQVVENVMYEHTETRIETDIMERMIVKQDR